MKPPITEHHRVLAYIREHYPNIPAFCDANGLDRLKVQKAIRGKFQQMDAKFAFEAEKATNGAVPASWWVEAPSQAEDPKSSGSSAGTNGPEAA